MSGASELRVEGIAARPASSAYARLALLGAALLAGAGGIGLEVLLVASASLPIGQGRAGALGVAAFVAGWAIGARLVADRRGSLARALVVAGVATLAGAVSAPRLLLAVPDIARPGGALATALAALGIALAALPQGALLPLLLEAWRSASAAGVRLAPLWSASLAGGLVGGPALGTWLAGAAGRPGAATLAGTCSLIAAVVGALVARDGVRVARGAALDASRGALDARGGALDARGAEKGGVEGAALEGEREDGSARAALVDALAVGLGTAWLVGLEWIALRLGALWLGGMQAALAAVLAAALAALALGALLVPPLLPASRRGVALGFLACAAASAWLVLGPRVAELSDGGPLFPRALALVGPALLPFGALVPLVERCARARGGRRLAGLLVHEAWGAALGGPLVHFALVPSLGLGGATGALCALGAVGALALARGGADRVSLGAAALCALVGLALVRAPEPALASPPLAKPALELLAFEEDADFAVAVVDDGMVGERTLLTDDFRAAGTGRAYRYMRVLGHLPVLLHPEPRRACVLALGTGTTVGAVSLHAEVERIDVLELSAAVVRQAPFFESVNRGALAEGLPGLLDPTGEGGAADRVVVRLGDGRAELARHAGEYDVLTLEPLLPDSPFGVHLYTEGFYARARASLAPGGIVCQWVPPHALEPASFDAVLDAFARSFPWSGAWLFGTQAILIGADAAPSIAGVHEGDVELGAALAELGLADAAGVAARFVGELPRGGLGTRRLTDADPWILYRPRRAGAVRLGDLPANLARLLALWSEHPPAGIAAADPNGRRAAVRELRLARLAHARAEAGAVLGADEARRAADERGERLAHAALAFERAGLDGPDPELAELVAEVVFLQSVRDGVSALASGATEPALDALLTAAELYPERADVHLYVAAALQRLAAQRPIERESLLEGASRALAAALARAPRAFETREGRRALELGLAPGALPRR